MRYNRPDALSGITYRNTVAFTFSVSAMTAEGEGMSVPLALAVQHLCPNIRKVMVLLQRLIR